MMKLGMLAILGALTLVGSGCGIAPHGPLPTATETLEASKANPPKLKPTKAKKAVDSAIVRAATKDPLSYATLYGLKIDATDNPVVYTFTLKAVVKTSKEILTYPEVKGLYSTKTNTVPKLDLGEVSKKPR